ncbi:Beta-1,3-N-Acetylglucosaminyltransferase family protein [Dorcoceras hygrometricum]|nr:Beta-1,3-N-Acetylglucosaminyltransferase family protein [Dorcoceras hygrometricum]
MEAINKLVLAIFFAAVMTQACDLEELIIKQEATGSAVGDQTQWNVTITNACAACSQSRVTLLCQGLQTVEPLNTEVVTKSGDYCLINKGLPVFAGLTLGFTYSWEKQFEFEAYSSMVNCS